MKLLFTTNAIFLAALIYLLLSCNSDRLKVAELAYFLGCTESPIVIWTANYKLTQNVYEKAEMCYEQTQKKSKHIEEYVNKYQEKLDNE